MKALRTLLQVALLISAFLLAAGITGPHLVRSMRINGWLPPSGTVETVAVTRKWHHPGPEGTYWVSWAEGDALPAEDRRLNVSPDAWHALSVGDRLEIVRMPGSSLPYLRETQEVPLGLVGFDGAFLVLQLIVGVIAAGPLLRRRGRPSTRRSASRDNVVLTVSPEFVFRPHPREDDRLVFIERDAG